MTLNLQIVALTNVIELCLPGDLARCLNISVAFFCSFFKIKVCYDVFDFSWILCRNRGIIVLFFSFHQSVLYVMCWLISLKFDGGVVFLKTYTLHKLRK